MLDKLGGNFVSVHLLYNITVPFGDVLFLLALHLSVCLGSDPCPAPFPAPPPPPHTRNDEYSDTVSLTVTRQLTRPHVQLC